MRLWTLHTRYLDAKGLVALWREALLAQKVLQGKTKGYRHHPQLIRFQHIRGRKLRLHPILLSFWKRQTIAVIILMGIKFIRHEAGENYRNKRASYCMNGDIWNASSEEGISQVSSALIDKKTLIRILFSGLFPDPIVLGRRWNTSTSTKLVGFFLLV